MDIQISVALTHHIPQLDTVGEHLVASIQSIADALTSLEETLTTELQEIADALANNPSQDEVDAVRQRVDDLRARVANIIPNP